MENDYQEIVFRSLGTPYRKDSSYNDQINSDMIDEIFPFAFENRVGLYFLEKCDQAGIELSSIAKENLDGLRQRRSDTEDVLIKLTDTLDKVHKDKWVLFKTIKPFPSTPNDTDWFPFDDKDHAWLCDHLLSSGFSFLEKAPLQTTLIDDSGVGEADSDKRGGVWYIDCYVAPGADYFRYLDPNKLARYFTRVSVKGKMLPALTSPAELLSICYHNVFPERTYSIESFYLILHYLSDIEENNMVDDFIFAVRDNHVSRAVSANLSLTKALHQHYFGFVPGILDKLLDVFSSELNESFSAKQDELPYNFTNSCFWRCFFEKLKDPVSFKSIFVQAFHMLNPVFCYGVIKILIMRMKPGSVYKQM